MRGNGRLCDELPGSKFLVGYSHSYQTGRSHQPFRIGRRLKADSFAVTYYRADPRLCIAPIQETSCEGKVDRVGDSADGCSSTAMASKVVVDAASQEVMKGKRKCEQHVSTRSPSENGNEPQYAGWDAALMSTPVIPHLSPSHEGMP